MKEKDLKKEHEKQVEKNEITRIKDKLTVSESRKTILTNENKELKVALSDKDEKFAKLTIEKENQEKNMSKLVRDLENERKDRSKL